MFDPKNPNDLLPSARWLTAIRDATPGGKVPREAAEQLALDAIKRTVFAQVLQYAQYATLMQVTRPLADALERLVVAGRAALHAGEGSGQIDETNETLAFCAQALIGGVEEFGKRTGHDVATFVAELWGQPGVAPPAARAHEAISVVTGQLAAALEEIYRESVTEWSDS